MRCEKTPRVPSFCAAAGSEINPNPLAPCVHGRMVALHYALEDEAWNGLAEPARRESPRKSQPHRSTRGGRMLRSRYTYEHWGCPISRIARWVTSRDLLLPGGAFWEIGFIPHYLC